MSIFIYRRASSSGARLLAEELNARRIKRERLMMVLPRARDLVVVWGDPIPEIQGVRYLNNVPLQSKYRDALALKAASVPTVEVRLDQPRLADVVQEAQPDPAIPLWERIRSHTSDLLMMSPFGRTAEHQNGVARLGSLADELLQALRVPAPQPSRQAGGPDPSWLPRLNNHMGGIDLLNPPQNPDYFVKREHLVREFRVHSFAGKSIRAGLKVHREHFANPHPWIRSLEAGWRLSYGGETSPIRQKHRDVAHAAVGALGLAFGAVDLGEREDGSIIVLEVNRAAGLEGGTVEAYANAIRQVAEAHV